MVKERTVFEKYRTERSTELVLACLASRHSVSAVLYDTALERRYARAVTFGVTLTNENAVELISNLINRLLRESCVSGNAVKKLGFAAPADITMAVEELLSPSDIFLPPDIEIVILPMLSCGVGGEFTAAIAAALQQEGSVIAADVTGSLKMAAVSGEKMMFAELPLKGGLDGTALESGMPLESGAIEFLDREKDGTICYSVAGDGDSLGISAAAAVDAVRVMRETGALDSDGIMTDRDLFYIGEDFYISQADVRAIQSDKASVRAGLELIGEAASEYGSIGRLVVSGEAFGSERGAAAAAALGAVPRGLADKYGWCRLPGEQGVIACLVQPEISVKIHALCSNAEDISDRLYAEFDELYIKNLGF